MRLDAALELVWFRDLTDEPIGPTAQGISQLLVVDDERAVALVPETTALLDLSDGSTVWSRVDSVDGYGGGSELRRVSGGLRRVHQRQRPAAGIRVGRRRRGLGRLRGHRAR